MGNAEYFATHADFQVNIVSAPCCNKVAFDASDAGYIKAWDRDQLIDRCLKLCDGHVLTGGRILDSQSERWGANVYFDLCSQGKREKGAERVIYAAGQGQRRDGLCAVAKLISVSAELAAN